MTRGLAAAVRLHGGVSLEVAWQAFVRSRLIVFGAAWMAAATFPLSRYAFIDVPSLSRPFGGWPLGGVLDFLLSPLARWDALWYLQIAQHGYTPASLPNDIGTTAAFFPLYPGLLHVFGLGTASGSLIAGYLISGAAFLAALAVMYRLTALELGEGHARSAVRLLAFFPLAYFFAAPYTESLFLLLSLCAFYAARRERWVWACVAAALAGATRNTGLLLILPLALIYLYGPRNGLVPAVRGGWRGMLPRYRLAPSVGWLALCPLGVVAFSLYLSSTIGDASAWVHAQDEWSRASALPTEGLRQGAVAAWHGLEHLGADVIDLSNILNFAAAVLVIVAIVGIFRSLPVAYGAYTFVAVLPTMSAPTPSEPLHSLYRYVAVLFPSFMWLALRLDRRGVSERVVFGSGIALALLAAGFATWEPFI